MFDINKKLMDALGLPPNTTWFELTACVGEPLLMRFGYQDKDKTEVLNEHEIVGKQNNGNIEHKLLTTLGLPPKVTYFSLSGSDSEVLQMRVGYLPDINQDSIIEALGEYEIVRRPKPKDEKDIDEVKLI